MIKLVKRNKLGFDMYTVAWSVGAGEFLVKDFWSEEHARTFIGRKWHHLDMNKIPLEQIGK